MIGRVAWMLELVKVGIELDGASRLLELSAERLLSAGGAGGRRRLLLMFVTMMMLLLWIDARNVPAAESTTMTMVAASLGATEREALQ